MIARRDMSLKLVLLFTLLLLLLSADATVYEDQITHFLKPTSHPNGRVPIVCNWAAQSNQQAIIDIDAGITDVDLGQQWSPMKIVIVNSIYKHRGLRYVRFFRCTSGRVRNQDQLPYVVASGSRACEGGEQIEHRVNGVTRNTKVADAFKAVRVALRSIEKHFNVKYQKSGTGKIAVSSSQEDCGIPTNDAKFDFRNDDVNTGVVVSLTPFENDVWGNQTVWAIPCSYDANGHRPFLIRVNINPMILNKNSNYKNLVPHVVHAMMHALFFWTAGQQVELKSRNDNSNGMFDTVAYGGAANGEVLSKNLGCDTAGNLEADEELMLQNISQYAPSTTSRVFGHWESRYIANDVLSQNPDPSSMRLTTATLTFIEKNLNTQYQIRENVSPGFSITWSNENIEKYYHGPGIETFPGLLRGDVQPVTQPGCGVMNSRCNTVEGGKKSLFCLPPNPQRNQETTHLACAAGLRSKQQCKLYHYSPTELTIPAGFRYFNDPTLGGEMVADFCPRKTGTSFTCDIDQFTNPTSTQNDFSGETYSANSRCFVASTVLSGLQSLSTPQDLRCYEVRCPFNSRVEFRLHQPRQGADGWTKCPADGSAATITVDIESSNYHGQVECPAATEVCTSSNLVPPVPMLSWKKIPGYKVEFAVIPEKGTFAANQAACGLYDRASAPFIPDKLFAEHVLAAVREIHPAQPSDSYPNGSFWLNIGAQTLSWTGMQGYNASGFELTGLSAATDDTQAVLVNGVGVVSAVVASSLLLPWVCTRAVERDAWALMGCNNKRAEEQFCQRINTTSVPHSQDFFVPQSGTPWMTRTIASTQACPWHGASLLDLAQEGSDEERIGATLSWLSSVYGTAEAPFMGVWTGLTFTVGAAAPAWSKWARFWPSSPSGQTYCFLLARTVANTTHLELVPVLDCATEFPVMCYNKPDLTLRRVPGYSRAFRYINVGASRSEAVAACASLNSTLAPLFDYHGWTPAITEYSKFQGRNRYVKAGAYEAVLVGGRISGGDVIQEQFQQYPLSSAANSVLLPLKSDPNYATFNDAVGFKNKVGTTEAIAVDSPQPFACASYISMGTGSCSNGSWCGDDTVYDNEVVLIHGEPRSFDDAVDACTAMEGKPFMTPPLPLPNWRQLLTSVLSDDDLTVAWAGMKYINGALQVNGSTLSEFDPTDASLIIGLDLRSLVDGDCLALTRSGGAFKFIVRPCEMPLPYLCRKPLITGQWVSMNFTTMPAKGDPAFGLQYLEYALVRGNTTHADGSRLCRAAGGELAFFPYGSTNPELVSGLLFDEYPSLANYGNPFWIGMVSVHIPPNTKGKWLRTFDVEGSSQYVSGSGQTFCFTGKVENSVAKVNGGSWTQDAGCSAASKFDTLCTRFAKTMNYSMPLEDIIAGVAGKIQIDTPEVADDTKSVTVKAVSNFTGFTTEVTETFIMSLAKKEVSFTIPTVNVSRPEYVSFEISVDESSTAGFKKSPTALIGRRSFVVWPTHVFNVTEPTKGVEGETREVTISTDTPMQPGSSVTLQVISSNPAIAELNVPGGQVTISADSPSARVQAKGVSGGTAVLNYRVVSCLPAHMCFKTPAYTEAATFRFQHGTLLQGHIAAGKPAGKSNPASGSYVKFLYDPSPAVLQVEVEGTGSLFISPSTFTINSQTFGKNHDFVMSSGVAGDFNVTATVRIVNQADFDDDTLIQARNETLDLGNVTFTPTYPLSAILISNPLVYPGQEAIFNVSVPVFEKLMEGEELPVEMGYSDIFRYFGNQQIHTVRLAWKNDSCWDGFCMEQFWVKVYSDVNQIKNNIRGKPLLVDGTQFEEAITMSVSDVGDRRLTHPIPPVLPSLTVVLHKRISVSGIPMQLLTGGAPAVVTISIPQTPVVKPLLLTWWCFSSEGWGWGPDAILMNVSSVSYPPNDFTEDDEILRRVQISSPAGVSISDAGDEEERKAGRILTCRFNFTAGADFIQTDLPQQNVTLYPRAKSEWRKLPPQFNFGGQQRRVALPNTTFELILFVGQRYGRVTTANTLIVTPSADLPKGVTMRMVGDSQDVEGGILYRFQVHVADNAPGNDTACVSPHYSTTLEYEAPTAACFQIPDLSHLEPQLPGPEFTYAHPIGNLTRQEVKFKLDKPTLFQPVEVSVFCQPGDTSTFPLPPGATETARLWSAATGGTQVHKVIFPALATSVASVWIEGLHPGTLCDLRANATGGAEFRNVSFVKMLPQEIMFIEQLYTSVTKRTPGMELFPNDANSQELLVVLPRIPTENVTVSFSTDSQFIAVDPMNITFVRKPNEVLTRVVKVTLTQAPSDLTPSSEVRVQIRANIVSDAREIHADRERLVEFQLRPLIETRVYAPSLKESPLLAVDVKKLGVYSNGEAAGVTLTVNITQLPVGIADRVRVELVSGDVFVTSNPTVVVFTRVAGHLGATLNLICRKDIPFPRDATVEVRVDGPPQFAPGGLFVIELRQLASFRLGMSFDDVFPMIEGTSSFLRITPTALPQKGTQLVLRLSTSCGDALVHDTGSGPRNMVWTSQDENDKYLKLSAQKPTSSCQLTLAQDPSSTAPIFDYYAFQTVGRVLPIPKVSFERGSSGDRTNFLDTDIRNGVRFSFSTQDLTINETLPSMRGAPTAEDEVAAFVVSNRQADQGTFIRFLAENPTAVRVVRSTASDKSFDVLVQGPNFNAASEESLTIYFTRHLFQRNQVAPDPLFNSFNFTISPVEQDLDSVQRANVGSSVVVTTVTSVMAGPALATQGAKVAALLDAGNCPLADWKKARQKNMDLIENPIQLQIGSINDLGLFFGATITNWLFVGGWVFVHLVAVFLAYAYRRDQAVADTSVVRALASMRFPAIDAFPLIYFAPLIIEHSLRVVMYSENTALRVIDALILAVTVIGVPMWVLSVIRNPNIVYDTLVHQEPSIWKRLIVALGKYRVAPAPRGETVTESRVRQAAVLQYGLIIEDFAGHRKMFLLADVLVAMAVGGLNAYEPTTKRQCVIKFGTMLGIFGSFLLATIILLPYRRHAWNLFFILVSLAQTASCAISLGLLAGAANADTGAEAANIAMLVVANLLILKCVADIVGVCAQQLTRKISRKAKTEKRRFLLLDDEEEEGKMTAEDVFPSLDGIDSEELSELDELDDDNGVRQLVSERYHKRLMRSQKNKYQRADSKEAPLLQKKSAAQVAEEERQQEILDII